jgi:8-oxo-dGTP pyrophosphatase MutT (NUDIX family)
MKQNELNRLLKELPRHPNILGKERFFNAAVLIPLVLVDQEYSFLFQKRAAHIRQGGEVSFPGGEFEPGTDASCREAAVREAVEELGIPQERIEVKGRLDTFISPRGITVDAFLGLLDIGGIDELNPDTQEVERVFLLPVSLFEQTEPEVYHLKLEIHPYSEDRNGKRTDWLPVEELGLPKRYASTWRGLEHRVMLYKTPEEIVWGITAELVYEVVGRLKKSAGRDPQGSTS